MRRLRALLPIAGALLFVAGALDYYNGTVPSAVVIAAFAVVGLVLLGVGQSLRRRKR